MTQAIGTELRKMRERAGLTAREVALRAPASEAYLSRVETNQATPSNEWLSHIMRTIANALGTSETSSDSKDDRLVA